MSQVVLERRRTGWDIVFGIILVLAGLVILGNAVVATAVSVLFLGWMALISGVVLFIASFFRIKSGGFWSAALGGALLTVLGLFTLRNTGAAVVTLTLLTGALFFAGGLARIFAAPQFPEARWIFVVSGIFSVVLGLIVLFNLAAASLTLLGILLGVQTLIEGFTLMIVGRVRQVTA
jgi:uncharacterized membrane protein HdeD (DUF308 family)